MPKISEFMKYAQATADAINARSKGTPRHRTTYRAARRNIAKIAYRKAKRAS